MNSESGFITMLGTGNALVSGNVWVPDDLEVIKL